MNAYLNLLHDVYTHGQDRPDRTDTGVRSLPFERMRFSFEDGFPILTTKEVFFKGVTAELLWFLSGSESIDDLPEYVRHWWEPWADEDGQVGPLYGSQMRDWGSRQTSLGYMHGIDQVDRIIQQLQHNPYSRRHVISTWNVEDLDDMALHPCHGLVIQFWVEEGESSDDILHMQMYQRSGDMFIGVPVNISSYSLLLALIAHCVGMVPGTFTHVLGDAHIYHNHIEQVEEQFTREPRGRPTLQLNENIGDIDQFMVDDIDLVGYNPHPSISAPVAV